MYKKTSKEKIREYFEEAFLLIEKVNCPLNRLVNNKYNKKSSSSLLDFLFAPVLTKKILNSVLFVPRTDSVVSNLRYFSC
jgi:hypothetical protein